MTRIVLLSQDDALISQVRELLRSQGFNMDSGSSAEAVAPPRARFPFEEHPSVVIVDANLSPEVANGELRRIRTATPAPVLVLAQTDSPDERIACLEAGADDCLGRPFQSRELLARLRALLRRNGVSIGESPPVEVNGVRVLHASREVFCDGKPVETTTVEFEILSVLIRSAGHPVSRDQLMEVLYHRKATAYDRSIDMHVSHLRKKLAGDRVLIKTVRGAGYQFCATPPMALAAAAAKGSGA